jgi:hypothetical protein
LFLYRGAAKDARTLYCEAEPFHQVTFSPES